MLPVNLRPILPYQGILFAKPDNVCPDPNLAPGLHKTVPVDVTWSNLTIFNSVVEVNLRATGGGQPPLTRILSVFIDNANVPFGVGVTFPDTGFTITCPAFTQRYSQVISGDVRVQVFAMDSGHLISQQPLSIFTAGTTRVFLLDSARPPYQFDQPSSIGGHTTSITQLIDMSSSSSASIFLNTIGLVGDNTGIFRVTNFQVYTMNLYVIGNSVLENILFTVLGWAGPNITNTFTMNLLLSTMPETGEPRTLIFQTSQPFELDTLSGEITVNWTVIPAAGRLEFIMNGYFPATASV